MSPDTSSTLCTTELRRAAALAALFATPGLIGTVHAQDNAAGSAKASDQDKTAKNDAVKLDDVVVLGQVEKEVSSPKYTEPLLNTPQTIVVIPSDVYAQQGAVTLSDVLRNTPGITFAAGEGGGASATAGDAFYMRGFDASNNIFVDGVRDVGAYSRDVYNTESVEVAKGTGGTDIGRGGPTGYINIVTKRPHLENFNAGTVAFGLDEVTSGSTQRVTLDLNRAVEASPVKGTAVRISLMGQDSAVLGRDTAEGKAWGVTPSLAFGLGTPFRSFFSYQHEEQNGIPDYGLPSPAYPGYTSTPMPPAIASTNFYGFTADFDDAVHDGFLARFESDLSPDFLLSNTTRASWVARNAIVTAPGTNTSAYVPATGLLTRSRQGNKRDTDIITNQTNLVGKFNVGPVFHDFSTGVELIRETAYQPAFGSIALTPIPVQSPDPAATPDGIPARTGAYTDAQTDTVAAYFNDTLKFSEKWLASAGLRVDSYNTDYLSIAAATGVATRISAKDDLWSWKAGLVFKPIPAASLYGSFGVSFRPPGTDFALSTADGNQNNPNTEPQETTNIEVGIKWDLFNGRLQATGALFDTVNSNTVFTDPVLGPVAAGEQSVRGIELGLSGRVNDDLLIYGGFAYLDSAVDVGTAAQIGYGLPLIPKYSGNVWTTYRLNEKFTFGGGVNYQGETNRLQNTAGVSVTMPAYWLVNALVSYQVNPHVVLRFNINNLFDEEYVRSFNNNGGRFAFGTPRNFLLTAEFKF
jgi:catecholate siderophore receptor